MNFYRHIADKAALELAYSPSHCVPNFNEILRKYASCSDKTKQVSVWQTHRYGVSSDEFLDIFWPAGGPSTSPRSALVYLHGGYWQELSKDEHAFPADEVNANGLAYVAVNYGLAPQASLDQIVERCRRALVWLVANASSLGIDPGEIHVAGCSAGAQLAAMVALTASPDGRLGQSHIKSLILLSGVYDLRPLPLTYINDAVRMSPDDALRNSPLLLIDAFPGDFPPAAIAFGEHEPDEFKRQSREFAEAIARKGGCAALREIAGRNHFDLIFDLMRAGTALGDFTLARTGGAGVRTHPREK